MPKATQPGEFFVVGGPVQADRACYVERRADSELLAGIENQRFCYVLSPRATGKSSLMARTIRSLRARRQLAAHIDLNQIGARGDTADPGRWYYSIAYRIVRELRLKLELQAWWQDNSALPSEQRLAEFFSEIVLAHTTEPVTIFFDEVERLAGLSFSDELFGVLHGCYVRRVSEPDFGRLNFVVLGAATPRQLCADPDLSPFTDGRSIALEDFTREECHRLAPGFACDEPQAFALLDRIHAWTHGQPYLTQKVARGVARKGGRLDDVERVVHEQFLAPRLPRDEPLISHIRAQLTRRIPGARQALGVLAKLASEPPPTESVPAGPREILELSGVALTDTEGRLRVRNRIYERVFDPHWARGALPFNWRLPVAAAAAVALAVAVPLWYFQVMPRPYLETLSAERVDVDAAIAAHAQLSRLPGHGARADRLLREAMIEHSRRAGTIDEVMAADAVLRRLPDGEARAEELLGDYWLRRARAAMHDERRDEALLLALEAVPGRGEPALRLGSELIGSDYPRLDRSFRLLAEPAWWEVDWNAGTLTVIDPAHRVQRFALAGDIVGLPRDIGQARRISGRLTALQHLPVSRELTVEDSGAAGAFSLELTVQHGRASDLRVTLTAPSGARASLPVPQPRADQQALRFEARDGSPLRALAGEARQGAWQLSVVDRRSGEAGELRRWGLRFAPDRRLWQDIPEQGVPLPDPVRTEQVEITLDRAGRFALARPTRPGISGAVAVWDLAAGRLVNDLEFQTAPQHVAFGTEVERVLAASRSTVTVWDVETGERIAHLQSDDGFVLPPVLGPDGDYAAVVRASEPVSGRPRIVMLRLADGESAATLEAPPGARGLALGPGARYLALLGASRVIHVLDTATGETLWQLPHPREIVRILPMAHAERLLSVDVRGDIYAWTLDDALGERTGGAPERSYVGTTVDPASMSLADAAATVAYQAGHGRVVSRSVPVGDGATPVRIERSTAAVHTRLAPDGRRLLTLNERVFRVWRTGVRPDSIANPDLSALALDRDGELAVLGFRGGHVRVRSRAESAGRAAVADTVDFIGHRGRITSLAVNAARNRIVSGGENGVVRTWDLASIAPTDQLLRHPEGPIHAVAVSPDGEWIASAAEYSARVWRAADGQLVGEVPVNGAALSVAFSPRGDAVAVGDSAGNVFFGAPRGTEPLLSARASAAVQAVAFSPDGRMMGTGDVQGNVRLWDTRSGEPASEPRTLSHPVSWVDFGGSGETLLARSGDWVHELRIAGGELEISGTRLLPLAFGLDLTPAPAPGAIRAAGLVDGSPAFLELDMTAPGVSSSPDDPALLERDWSAALGLRLDSRTGLVGMPR